MRYPPHVSFTQEEEERGLQELRRFGLPDKTPFICLIVRDGAYGKYAETFVSNTFRNSDIANYSLAIAELVQRGYFVIRMGATVRKPLSIAHKQVIDYAWNGLRSEFMDIYLAAKCHFCIATGTGWDSLASHVFRRPVVYTNFSHLTALITFHDTFLSIMKKVVEISTGRELRLKEIVDRELSCSSITDYLEKSVVLVENTPEEIRDVVLEMVERLDGTWHETEEDKQLQKCFWKLYPTNNGLHGKIYGRFGAQYLRDNKAWLADDTDGKVCE